MDIDTEIHSLNQIEAVRTVLKMLSRTLGLRIAVVARIQEGAWTACAILDEIGFGLQAGDHLNLAHTY
jgi:hypothetical protein